MKKVLVLLLLITGLAWAARVQVLVKFDRSVYKSSEGVSRIDTLISPKMGQIRIVNDSFISVGYMIESDSLAKDTLALAPWKRITGITIRVDTVKVLKAEPKQAEP